MRSPFVFSLSFFAVTPTDPSPATYGRRLRIPSVEATPPRPEDDLPPSHFYAFALLALRNLTMGVEQEVYVIDETGRLVNLSKNYPDLSVSAKALPPGIMGPRDTMVPKDEDEDWPYYLDAKDPAGFVDGKPALADGYFGGVNEAVDFSREFITAPFKIRNASDVRRIHVRLENQISQRLAKARLTHLFGSAPHLIPADGIKRTDNARYKMVRDRDAEGFDEGRTTAGLQINLGTIPKQIRSRLVGLAGDSSHLLLAISGASPFRWTSYSEEANYRWDASNPKPGDSFLVDTGFHSNRAPTWWKMRTAVSTPLAYTPKDLAVARDAHLETNGLVPAYKNTSLFHVQVREQSFGLEQRAPDTPPTVEERELVSLLSISDLILGLQRLVTDPRKQQLPGQVRADAAWDAAKNGMNGDLIDPDTGRPRNGYDILNDRLDAVRAGLEAYERGDLAGVLHPDNRAVDGVSTSTIYNRAKEVLGILKEIGTPADRMRAALENYRTHDASVPPEIVTELPSGQRIVTEDEAQFLHAYTLAEQRVGLTTDRDFVYERAIELKELAERGQLPLQTTRFTPEMVEPTLV
jgi:gamma-glutamyl:cysteine ligase YbdK (ATP-grasp superfamily)